MVVEYKDGGVRVPPARPPEAMDYLATYTPG
jgi:hypothetical protein